MPENTKDGAEIGSLERAVGERKGIDLAQDVAVVARSRARRAGASTPLHRAVQAAVLREADACSKPGEIGALLRREGLYSSLLTEWRQRERGSLAALDRPRGRPKTDPREAQIAALKRRLERAEADLEKARRTRRSLMFRFDGVVPFRVKRIAVKVDGCDLVVGDADLVEIGALVEAGVDLQAAARGRRADQVDDRLQRVQRLAAPVDRDVAKQSVLDAVPLPGARRRGCQTNCAGA